MTDQQDCNDFRAMLPLLAAGTLEADEQRRLQAHLDTCQSCQLLLERETALYEAAQVERPEAPLADHPESELLDRYARRPDALSSAERARIESYLENNPSAQTLIEKLRSLPSELEDLVDISTMPLTNSISSPKEPSVVASISDRLRGIIWHPAVGYATAAVILLTAILWQGPSTRGPANLDARLHSETRGGTDLQIIQSPTRECYLNLTYCISPEPGHQYDVGLSQQGKPGYLFWQSDVREFDRSGCFSFSSLLVVGDYEFHISDIVARDTVTVVRQFRVELSK